MSDPFIIMLASQKEDPFMLSLIKKKFEDFLFRPEGLEEDFLPFIVAGSGIFIGRHGCNGIGDFYSDTHGGTGFGWF